MSESKPSFDVELVRPPVRAAQVACRGRDFDPVRRRRIRQALLTLHTLETMAATIYKFQITRAPTEHNRQLIAAMLNEMTHHQDFQVKLYEFGWRPSPLRWAYWLVGFGFGFGSRLLGRRAVLKIGIWVESKAVTHYAELLEQVDWDEATRQVVAKDQADEDGHIQRWRRLLAEG